MSEGLDHLFSPGIFDIVFPFFAFFFVILLPSAFGLWVVACVLSGRYSGEDKKL